MKLKEYLETRKIKNNILKVIFLTVFVLSLNSLSYAYFTSSIEGEGKQVVLSTSDISIKFTDNEAINKTGLTPGEEIIKTFSIKNNSEGEVEYKINWEYLINNFTERENLVYSLSSTNSGGTLSERQLPDSEEHINIVDNITIASGDTQTYTMKIRYIDNGQNQDIDKNKSLIGKIEVMDINGNSILPETSTGSSNSPITLERNLYGMTVETLMNEIYPVGSVYISYESTNPSEKFGGEWERTGEGRTLIGEGTGTDENNIEKIFTSGSTGGEYTHKLTETEMPKHTHTITSSSVSAGSHTHTISGTAASAGSHTHPMYIRKNATVGGSAWKSGSSGDNEGTNSSRIASAGAHTHSVSGTAASNGAHTHTINSTASNAGSDSFHNNIQPYITVYMWKRIS